LGTWPIIAGTGKRKKKGMAILQNKFEVLKSRVMQCGVEEKTIRRQEATVVECFKYEEEGHKCRECLLWRKKERVEEKPVHPAKGKVQETERKLRRAEEEKAACVAKPQEVQQGWKKSSIEELRKRAEEHCGRGILEETRLLELGWYTRETIVTYVEYERCRKKGCHMEENRGQGMIRN